MKNPLLSPKPDLVFKQLFAGDTDVLADLVNTALLLPEQRLIRSVEVRNPDILPEEITGKFIIPDIPWPGMSRRISTTLRCRFESTQPIPRGHCIICAGCMQVSLTQARSTEC